MTNENDYILVVDDERAIRDMVCMALVQEDFLCSEASDAHKAESMIKKNVPQLILLDWMMHRNQDKKLPGAQFMNEVNLKDGRHDCMDAGGRATQDAVAEGCLK